MTCFICLRTGKKVFNINLPCGKGQNTIKADLLEFLGVGDNTIEAHLTGDQYCCSVCMNVLDDIVRYKGKLKDQIKKRNLTQPDFGRLWNFVAKSEAKSEFKEKSDLIPHVRANTPPMSSSRDSTPTLLYVISKTKSYNEPLERKIERREGLKSDISKQALAKKNLATKEKYKIKSKAKKMKNDIVNKFQSERELYERPVSSAASELSFVSYTEEEKRQQRQPAKREIIYNGDEIVFPLKRTRSVSRSHEQNVSEIKRKKAMLEGKHLEETLDSCDVCGCNCYGNMEVYTAHKVEVHGLCGYFGCKYCDNHYLTQEHLAYHIKSHINPIACPICKTINLKTNSEAFASHMEQHIRELYNCRFCYKPFDNNKDLNQHISTKHKRKKLYMKDEGRIIQKYVYKPENEAVQNGGVKKYKWIDYGNVLEKNVELFRPITWYELDNLRQVTSVDVDSDGSEQLPRSSSEDSVIERLTDTPDSNGSFYDYKGIPPKNTIVRVYKDPLSSRPSSAMSVRSTTSSGHYTVYSKGGRSPSSGLESGRCTPWSTAGSAGEEDQEVMRMMNNQTPFFDLSHTRDLESSNTEVAEILAGKEDGYGPPSDEDISQDSDMENNSDDLDTENQYLEGNSFVSSISFMDESEL